MVHLLPSTKTVLLSFTKEKPVPSIVKICPPMLPVGGDIDLTVGRVANSKYSPGSKDGFLKEEALFA